MMKILNKPVPLLIKIIFGLLILVFSTSIVFSQTIPLERLVNWQNAGCKQSMIEHPIILNILDFGASADGEKSSDSSITAAINQLNGQSGVIYMPKGTYLFTSTIVLPSNVILRGYSSDSTHLVFDLPQSGNQNCISAGGSTQRDKVYSIQKEPVISSFFLDLDAIPVCKSGDYAEIYEENGDWDIKPASWAGNAVGQIVRIKSVEGSRIELYEPLRISFSTELNPIVELIEPVFGVGIEYLKIERLSQSANPKGNNISFNLAVNCWVKGVESYKSAESHIMITSSSNIEISGSYFHHSFGYDGVGTRGYGITLNNHSGECLIENNIFNHLRHSMVLKKGANGNVLGYNYSIDPYRTETPHNAGADICLHGHYAFSNLIEGNIVQNILIDHYWGPSGPLNTFFRNRAELYGLIMTNSTLESSNQNFVGNEISNSSIFYGNFILTGSNHFSFGNNVNGRTEPQGSTFIKENSFYLQEKPVFWNITGNWPSLGYPNKLNSGTIPAKSRYLKGKCMTINPGIEETSISPKFSSDQICIKNVFPNPFSNKLTFEFELKHEELIKVEIIDLSGKTVHSSFINGSAGMNKYSISIEPSVSSGFCFLIISSEEGNYNRPLLKN